MLRVLVSNKHAEVLQRVLDENGLEAEIEVAMPDQADQALVELARLPADTLILDADTRVTETAVQRYKLARPNVRIILLAVDREPGDPQVARIVASRVDDVVTEIDRIPIVMLRPASYHDTLRWLAPHVVEPDAGAGKKVVEKVIVRKVASTTRPVVIVVNSYLPAAGCTTVAVSVAAFLTDRGHKVALVETVERGQPGVLGLFVDGSPRLAGNTWRSGLKVWSLEEASEIRDIMNRHESEYIVIDDAMRFSQLFHDIADLKLIAVPDCSWRLPDLVIFKEQVCGQDIEAGQKLDFLDFILLVSGPGKPGTKKVLNAKREEYPVMYLGYVDLDDDLHTIAETTAPCLSQILEPYLPDQAPKRPWYRRLARKLTARRRRPAALGHGTAAAPAAQARLAAAASETLRSLGAAVASVLNAVWFTVQMVLPWAALIVVVWAVLDPHGRTVLTGWMRSLFERIGLQL